MKPLLFPSERVNAENFTTTISFIANELPRPLRKDKIQLTRVIRDGYFQILIGKTIHKRELSMKR